MSICSPCTKTIPIVYCSDSVYIGDWIAGVGVDVQVWWMNTANGRVGNAEVTTLADGKVTVDIAGKMEGASYEVWINEETGKMMVKDAFYLPNTTTSVDCVTVEFQRAYDGSDAVTVAESTLTTE